MISHNSGKKILLTGATGYVGGRLLEVLKARDYQIRCLVRDPGRVQSIDSPQVEVVAGDVLHVESLNGLFAGVDIAFYLIHSMGASTNFAEQDSLAAINFAKAAKAAGVKRIIYLGGLGDPKTELSKHLASRHETGVLLRKYHPLVVELRASIVIGSGSLSFELIRSLVERLPIMICPKWVEVEAQPIAIEDLLQYLIAAIDCPLPMSQVFEIGGPERVSYGDIMREYALQRGLRRWMIPIPLLTPRLSSLWLGLVTPLYARIGRKIVDSMRNPTVVNDESARQVFDVKPRSISEAIDRALKNEDHQIAQTRWSDALSSSGHQTVWGGRRFGSRLVDHRSVILTCSETQAFQPIRRIGGTNGWYYANWLWIVRGFIDLLLGGVGVRRGRRDGENLCVGDTVDFWRVEAFDPPRRLRLRAEMKLPGRAWLEFNVTMVENGTQITQTASFDPLGLWGLGYWYLIFPLHQLVFAGMLQNIARAATSSDVTKESFSPES